MDYDDAWTVGGDSGPQQSKRWDERHLARLGAVQDGIVRLDQLSELGLSKDARKRRLLQERLIVLHRGVYAVGHGDVSERGRMRAAVWAAGEGAALSHLAAARLLGLWERPVWIPSVTVPSVRRPRLEGVHRAARFEVTHVRGIPCTSVSQTLVDVAPTPQLEAVFERAERKRRVRPEVIERMVHNRPGADRLRALLKTHRPHSGPTRSVLERRLLGALRVSGVPEPIVNGLLQLGQTILRPDLMWPAPHKVLVELDGGTHATATAMKRDRARDRLAIRHGWTPLRGTWHDDPAELVSDIRAALRE